MLIQAFLQLTPGIFSIFYHSALAKHSDKKADDLSLYFILGVEFFFATIFMALFLPVSFLFTFQDFMSELFPWLMSGILGALSVASFFYYFRNKETTLFISRRVAKNLTLRAEKVKNRSDAFLLGFFSGVPELLFTLPLIIISLVQGLESIALPTFPIIILYIISATLPLFLIRAFYRGGLNLADIEKLRVKNQPFFRLTITLSFLFLMILVIISGII